jgi:hypothetical protein
MTKLIVAVSFAILLLPAAASAAIAFDSTGSITNAQFGGAGTTQTSPSVSITGSNITIIIQFQGVGSATICPSGVTFGGVSMTEVGATCHANAESGGADSTWYLTGLSTQSSTFVVTNPSSQTTYAAWADYTGTAATLDNSSAYTDVGTATTAVSGSITPAANNSWTIMFGQPHTNFTLSAGVGTIRQNSGTNSSGNYIIDSNGPVTGGISNTISATWSSAVVFTYNMISLAPFVAATAATPAYFNVFWW